MSLFFLGVIVSGLIMGSIAFNCYNKREIVEKSLRTNIENLEYNLSIIKKESQLKIEQLSGELKKARDENRNAVNDIDMMNKDINSLKRQLAECKKALAEA